MKQKNCIDEKNPIKGIITEEINDFSAQIYDKKINFLIGSGASVGALPTLSTSITKYGSKISFENLVSDLEHDERFDIEQLLFKEEYCEKIIKPSFEMDYRNATPQVYKNYKSFLEYILFLLSVKKHGDPKRCNIFSTNYDLFVESAAEKLMQQCKNFILNDGSDGFWKKVLSASNFNKQVNNIGIFDQFISEIPILNLIKLHGSVSWEKENDNIIVDYNNEFPVDLPTLTEPYLADKKTYEDLIKINIEESDKEKLKDFWDAYRALPIVNPTKWKFNETVFEQHYYQMLRLLSYELEKKDVVLIVFGFSFADEHIYELVQRSLMNPTLTVFIFCHDKKTLDDMKAKFGKYRNVFYIFKHRSGYDTCIRELVFDDFNKIIRNDLDNKFWTVGR